jgi:hypothetical protein
MLRRKKPSASFALVGMSGFSVRHYLRVLNTDPQLSVEAGWDPVIKQINCETGQAITLAPEQKPAVAG